MQAYWTSLAIELVEAAELIATFKILFVVVGLSLGVGSVLGGAAVRSLAAIMVTELTECILIAECAVAPARRLMTRRFW